MERPKTSSDNSLFECALVVSDAKKYARNKVLRQGPLFPVLSRHTPGHAPIFGWIADVVRGSRVVELISDFYTHVWIAGNISLPRFAEGLQIKMVLIANAVDGHRMRN